MSTKNVSILTTCLIIAAGIILLVILDDDMILNKPLQNNVNKIQDTSSLAIQKKQNVQGEHAETYSGPKHTKTKQANTYSYEDDWCSIYSDLNEQEKS